jgi:hypothetical protein
MDERDRSLIVRFRASEREFEAFASGAKKAGVRLSEYVRLRIFGPAEVGGWNFSPTCGREINSKKAQGLPKSATGSD